MAIPPLICLAMVVPQSERRGQLGVPCPQPSGSFCKAMF